MKTRHRKVVPTGDTPGLEGKLFKIESPGGPSGMVRLLAALAVLGLAVLAIFWLSRVPEPRRIDTAVVVQETLAPAGGAQAPLRVAIAAMTSPERTSQAYTRLIRLVGEKIGRPVEISQRKTYAETNAMLEKREIDFAFVCSGAYVEGKARFGMEILAVPVVRGEKVYHSYILGRKGGFAKSFDDLRGKRFAFTDPKSNTGALVPRYMLAQRRETPESFFADSFFTYSHDNSIRAVAEGLADGAAVDSLIWEYFNAAGSPDTIRTRIIEKSPPYGIPPLVVHPAAAAGLKARLRAALFSLHEDAKAIPLLKELQIDRFEAGDDAMYDSVRQMERWIAQNPARSKSP